MIKTYQVLSSVVSGAMICCIAGFGCKGAETPAEVPKSAAQTQAPAVSASYGFEVIGGRLEKGGIGYVLSADKDKTAFALKKTDMPYKNIVKIKAQIKNTIPSGPRNGFVYFGENPGLLSKAGILIGAQSLEIEGPFVQKAAKPQNFGEKQVFDIELIINLREKSVIWKVDGTEVKTRMTARPVSINYIGYGIWSTKTELSELRVVGD
jgi:hypothetical protein